MANIMVQWMLTGLMTLIHPFFVSVIEINHVHVQIKIETGTAEYSMNILIDDNLNETVVNRYGIVKWEEVQRFKTLFDSGQDYLYNRIWLLIVLHKWLIKNHG